MKPDVYIGVVPAGYPVFTRPDPSGKHIAGPLLRSLAIAERNAQVAMRVLKRHRERKMSG